MTGTYDEKGNNFILKEEGDNKYDGIFECSLQNNKLSGTWQSYKKELDVTERTFELEKKEFAYNKEAMLPDERSYVDYYNGIEKR